ncbi:MAG: hypothetical protein HOJ57_14795 [Lentisphaerae bacterium]|jgi:hypothetical protein|nr:hypothetical protein [Lentisphaerota bacterium]MBT7061996.1 hypothetical protein [Lentisphaerota bacterium]
MTKSLILIPALVLIAVVSAGAADAGDDLVALFAQLDLGQTTVPDENLAKHLTTHILFIGKASKPAKEWFERGQEQTYLQEFTVESTVRGKVKGAIKTHYRLAKGRSPIEEGTRLLLLGNWHKTGFNIIAIGNPDEEDVARLREKLTSSR